MSGQTNGHFLQHHEGAVMHSDEEVYVEDYNLDYYTSTYGSLETIQDAIDAVQEDLAHREFLSGSSGHHYLPETTDRQTRRSALVRAVSAPLGEPLDA
jgi:hypothetical protein